MTEPVLHGLDVCPVAYEQGHLGVVELVELEPFVSRPLGAGRLLGAKKIKLSLCASLTVRLCLSLGFGWGWI